LIYDQPHEELHAVLEQLLPPLILIAQPGRPQLQLLIVIGHGKQGKGQPVVFTKASGDRLQVCHTTYSEDEIQNRPQSFRRSNNCYGSVPSGWSEASGILESTAKVRGRMESGLARLLRAVSLTS
jgi:hypothetical protein